MCVDDAARERARGCLHKLIESTMRLNQLDEYSLGHFGANQSSFDVQTRLKREMCPASG
jgi:hypothetical protein